jgi:hypothetical protein
MDSSHTFDDARQWQLLRAPGLQVAFLGSASITDAQAQLCDRIGAVLAESSHVAVATSGYAGAAEQGKSSFTIRIARSFARSLRQDEVDRRVTTFLVRREDGTLPRNIECIGRGVVVRGRSLMNRQAQIVAKADVLCVAGGGQGTTDFGRLALQIDKPVLPLPFFAGASRDIWNEFGDDVRTEFFIDDDQWTRWSAIELESLSAAQLDALSREIVTTLLRSARGTCLVCMPFAEAYLPVYSRIIEPAIAAAHLQPVRMDRTPSVGDIADLLRSEIDAARCLVAVVDELNPNVLYEVGFAHALRKPVILMQGIDGNRREDFALPFDVRTHRVVSYPRDLDAAGVTRSKAELHALLRASSHGL